MKTVGCPRAGLRVAHIVNPREVGDRGGRSICELAYTPANSLPRARALQKFLKKII